MATGADPGAWHVIGQLTDASNATLLVESGSDRFVYKPVRGERPLWDFPDGTLARREVAAFELSNLLGWDLVPRTRWVTDAPFGPGSVQDWVEATGFPVGAFPAAEVPQGWIPVISAVDERDQPLAVAHRDTDQLRRFALFDILMNNADRKGSHLLEREDGIVLGIDHGLGFHAEPKLRTVLWGFVGEPLPDDLCRDLERVTTGLVDVTSGLDRAEGQALLDRADRLLSTRIFPPPEVGPAIPWPPL